MKPNGAIDDDAFDFIHNGEQFNNAII